MKKLFDIVCWIIVVTAGITIAALAVWIIMLLFGNPAAYVPRNIAAAGGIITVVCLAASFIFWMNGGAPDDKGGGA